MCADKLYLVALGSEVVLVSVRQSKREIESVSDETRAGDPMSKQQLSHPTAKIHPRSESKVHVCVQKNLVQSLLAAAIKWTHAVHT